MRKYKKSLAVMLAISLCASFCTTSVYADEIHPNLNEKELYGEEINSEAVVSEETCEEEISEEVSEEISDSEEKSETVDSEEKSEIVDFEEPTSEDEPEPEETIISDEFEILDETEELNAAGDVSVNPTNFPDENFRNFISSNYDKDGDGIIPGTQISNIKTMDCSGKMIKDLKGIEYFTSLTYLRCGSNQLTSLNVGKNTALKDLSCFSNRLTGLDVSKNTALTGLYCYSNQLTSLNVSKNTVLTTIYCDDNRLTSLDVSKNEALITLYCGSNQLTGLDVSKNTALTILFCDALQLKKLDVSKNTALRTLNCGSNQLMNLDVSKNTALSKLYCDANQLTSLDVSKNTALTGLDCSSNQLTSLDVSNCPNILENIKTGKKVTEDGCVCYYDPEGYLTLKWDAPVKIKTPDSFVVEIFDDVKAGAWYVPAVQYAYDNNLMAGTNGGKSFSPDGKLTREQFTQVLYNWEGKPSVSNKNPFFDVKEGSWYINSVLWAKENGISNGKPDGTFGVGSNITRQDLARMLYIYAQNKGYDLTKNDDAIDGFSDKDRVAPYATDAMNWAVSQGIIGGKGGGRLDPVGNATRAECAQMMKKMLQNNLK